MTALAAGLALVPIALSAGQPGSEIQAPMAMVIMFGLLSSTILNIVAVPILYSRFGRPTTAPSEAVTTSARSTGPDAEPVVAS
jgi:Cu/Ag efflux pump CusA